MKKSGYPELIVLSVAAIIISSPAIALSAQIDGIFFNDKYSANVTELNLRGTSILNYMIVIQAYAGALYLDRGAPSDQALSDRPSIIELYYFHNILAEDFREPTAETIKKNTDTEGFSRILEELKVFNRLYREFKPGDRYRADYIPGKGATIYLNGKALGTVKGTEFLKAFFSIWIGKNPIDKGFRDRLLGKK